MTLSIIVVSYNTAELTLQTINSVVSDLKEYPELQKKSEILVIDNDSSDNSINELKKLKKTLSLPLTVIENQENVGFAKANNQGIKIAQGKYVLLLNSDTIVQPGALPALVTTLETDHSQSDLNRLGLVAAQLLNADRSFQPQGGSFPNLFTLAIHMLMLDDIPILGRYLPSTQHTGKRASHYHQLTAVDWVGGTAVLIRQEVLQEIGLLDENIFMYGEDVELCLRAHQHHWTIAIQPQAEITHLGSASSSSANAIMGEFKGYLYIWSKHKPWWQIPLAKALLQIGCLLRILLFGTIIRDQRRAHTYQEVLKAVNHF